MKAMMDPINAMTDVVIRLEERAVDRADKHFLMFNDQRTSYMLNALNFGMEWNGIMGTSNKMLTKPFSNSTICQLVI